MDQSLWIGLIVLHLVAVVDVWMSRLSTPARVLWSLVLIFMPIIGLAMWLLTRGSAHRPLEVIPEG